MRALVLLIVVCLSGCGIEEIYVAADRATYEVIAPSHQSYVDTDQSLTPEQKKRRSDLLDSWRIRIEKAEQK